MILRKFKPDVVLSFGGYVSVPVAAAATLLKIPVVIHEQTLQAGLANKVAAKFAKKICISWKESQAFFPHNKIVLTGNPLRTVFRNHIQYAPVQTASKVPTIYITGGSGGAHGINVLIEGCLEKLLENYYVVHQTGDAQKYKDFERLEKKKAALPQELQKRYMIKKFIDQEDVYHVMSAADLVISRSGINTVTELLYLGKPCLLIPLPYGQHNEQQTNARFVSYIGLGKTIDQLTTTSQELFAMIQDMVHNIASFKYHATEAHNLIQKDAAEKIIAVVKDVQEKKS
jgi:UDP-N-acetylglucosamine--N-acetylmuramyl-(pentapeptide) pyrophosphoryl-undecaprenol N-acetylglucosamine transferase